MILIYFNLWTSLNAHKIINIVGYFISKKSKCYYVVLRLYKIVSKYISKNIAGVLIDLFRDYGIISNIGYFMADNAESNNTCINAIFYTLYLNISAKICKGRQLYYFSYIINLYAQAFIIKSNAKGVYKELVIAYCRINLKKIKEL